MSAPAQAARTAAGAPHIQHPFNTTGLLEAATRYAAQGIRVLGFTTRPDGDRERLHGPRDWSRMDGEPADFLECLKVSQGWNLLALPTGHRFDVIDIDGPDGLSHLLHVATGQDLHQLPMAHLVEIARPLLPTCYGIASTPSGGIHLYIPPLGLPNGTGWAKTDRPHDGIDYRGIGGVAFAAPSTRPFKGPDLPPYQWLQPLDLDTPGVDPDTWRNLVDKLRPASPPHRAQKTAVSFEHLPREEPPARRAARRSQALTELRELAGQLAGMPAESGRNNFLNEAACKLGNYAPHWLSRAEIEDALGAAAEASGTPGWKATLRSGLDRGEQTPRAPWLTPEAFQNTTTATHSPELAPGTASHATSGAGAPEGEEPLRRRVRATPAGRIRAQRTEWLWRDEHGGRIPEAALTLIAGREGTGKSSFGVWLAAQVTQGLLPGSRHGQPGDVGWVAFEESFSHALKPRLAAAGADLDRVWNIDVAHSDDPDAEGSGLRLPIDTTELEAIIVETGITLLVLDPLASALTSGLKMNNSDDVRRALEPLVQVATRTGCTVVGIAHFNKGTGTDPASAITGASAWKDVPRAVLAFAKDRDGTRLFSQAKNSYGRTDLPSWTYSIEGIPMELDGLLLETSRLVMGAATSRTVQDVLEAQGDDAPAVDVEAALVEYIHEQGGAADANTCKKFLRDAGVSTSDGNLARLKKRLGIVSKRVGNTKWAWALADLHTDPSNNPAITLEETEPDAGGGSFSRAGGVSGALEPSKSEDEKLPFD